MCKIDVKSSYSWYVSTWYALWMSYDNKTLHAASMYAIFAYIQVVWGVNVGKYGMHVVSGIWITFALRLPLEVYNVSNYIHHTELRTKLLNTLSETNKANPLHRASITVSELCLA